MKRAFAALPNWPWKKDRTVPDLRHGDGGAGHLALARESLRDLIDLAVFGRVSTGKSSLLNALMGEPAFTVSPLHGETRRSAMRQWAEVEAGGVFLIDTPGLDEAGGEDREQLAREVAGRADLVIFVVDGDMTDTELVSLRTLIAQGRPVLVALNKSDLFTSDELHRLLESIRDKTVDIVAPSHVIAVAAQPRPQVVVEVDANGIETQTERARSPDIETLRLRLWDILEAEGKTLAALNASLFASDLSDQVGRRILAARREIAERLVRTYCVGKGIAVAFNPVPVADLFAAAFIDVGMVVHLSQVYGLPLSRKEAGSLVRVIVAESAALMGTVWALHFVSSALKVGTIGLSTILTAGTQGAIAYYSTYVVGQVAADYLGKGKSWGEGGPKLVVKKILDSLDKDTVLRDARREIRGRLGLG